ncbi:TIGR04283 family arsenosugar biosynthesis glycosyltransferase [Pseudozobellia thermophila]|uniref:Transferase 2, rSAM/selenodomain-associated n=1 Tax=Pseudozobellia thermophila TaxID=192903 RepID=A0A1M6D2M5_9FLAO|nr:TIGR04283 family arsenosugar biosynthesis glycosyltransferase [Pseudozobellia thermophila]SHI67507.1 transferase 2, rSAM/selenodomain-associated [Pseudozobellia thermophila]
MKRHTISIIIPVLNEEEHLGTLLDFLDTHRSSPAIEEIIVVDGGSSDRTVPLALKHGVEVLHSTKGRARQMNRGARKAKGTILYFLHADTRPPANFDLEILQAATEGFEAGCFRMRFDSNNLILSFFSWFTRFNHLICRGGDQSLFVSRRLFDATGGFNEKYIIYEDTEFIGRLYERCDFKVIPNYVTTSARKYHEIGTARLQYHFGVIHLKSLFGASPDQLYRYYKRKIRI